MANKFIYLSGLPIPCAGPDKCAHARDVHAPQVRIGIARMFKRLIAASVRPRPSALSFDACPLDDWSPLNMSIDPVPQSGNLSL